MQTHAIFWRLAACTVYCQVVRPFINSCEATACVRWGDEGIWILNTSRFLFSSLSRYSIAVDHSCGCETFSIFHASCYWNARYSHFIITIPFGDVNIAEVLIFMCFCHKAYRIQCMRYAYLSMHLLWKSECRRITISMNDFSFMCLWAVSGILRITCE